MLDDIASAPVSRLRTSQTSRRRFLALNKVDPTAASNPLINPPKEILDRVKQWPALSDQQVMEFNTAYAAVIAG